MTRPADTAHLPEATRARMAAIYRRILPASACAYVNRGEPHVSGVPKWVVRAWVIALHTAKDTTRACAAAHVGPESVERYGGDPHWAGMVMGRDWAERLAELELQTRPAATGVAA